MTITRANPGGWAQNDLLTPTQANTVDINTTLAPDFVNGGTYTPSALVNVGGSGIKLTGSGVAGRVQYSTRTISRALHMTAWIPPAATSYQLAPDPIWG